MKKKIWIGLSSVLAILLLAIVACTKDPTPDPVSPGGGNSGGGGSGGGSTGSAPSAPYALGCEPTNLGDIYSSEVKVTWTSVSNATKYKVYWSITDPYDDDSYLLIKTTSSTSTYHTGKLGKCNYYRVKAVNNYGESPMGSYTYCCFGGGKSE